jgi:hypothetical protein
LRTTEGFEVDFLVRYPEGGEELIQVCADLDAPATRERETRAMLAAGTERPGAAQRLISLAPENPHDLPRSIVWQPASEWLLSEHATVRRVDSRPPHAVPTVIDL